MRLPIFLFFVAASSAFAQFPVPSENVIVEFRDAPLALNKRATAARFQADIASIEDAEVRWEYSRVFHGVSATIPRASIAAVAKLPYVKAIHEDREMYAMAGAAVEQIRASQVWTSLGTRGKGIVVSVIDTGIDYNHEALGRGFGPGFKVIGGYDFANKDNDPLDDHGHGTHVAGIVAGNSASATGVAPEASLMAFKVLGANGRGRESDVIAAIEVSVDPNGDNDTSDHVDVINLSLGSRLCEGSPDDAASRAVDNAVKAGVFVAVAAGNDGRYRCISSPGLSRTAMTVGAVDSGDGVAVFSSRGPSQKDMTMKPEIGAPGVGIQSSLPNNRYGGSSGTSMAAPHVAGAAALLKALHPGWTPAEIKTALIINAGLTNQDVMTSGAGRIDVYRAATGRLTADKASIDFGLDSQQQGTWTRSRIVRMTNRGTQTATWNVTSSPVAGVSVSVSPASLTLAAGASSDVTLSIAVDNAAVTVPTNSLSAGGTITLTSGSEVVTVPWTFVKGVRGTITWEKDAARFVVLDPAHTKEFDQAKLEGNVTELLLPAPAEVDLFVFGSTLQNGALTRATFIYRELAQISGDMTIATTEAEAPHVIRGATLSADGKPLVSAADQTYAFSGMLTFPAAAAGTFKGMPIPWIPLHELRVNNIRGAYTLTMNETFVDFVGNAVYAIQHPAFKGINGDVTLAAAMLKSADVQLLIPPGTANPIIDVRAPNAQFSITRPYRDTVWNARLYLSPEGAVSFNLLTGSATSVVYQTPELRLVDGQITASAVSVPWWYHGSRFVFGGAPYFAVTSFSNVTFLMRPTIAVDLFGTLGEARPGERLRTIVDTYGGDGKLRATVANPASLDLTVRGPYRVEVTNDATQFPDLKVQTKLTMTLDSSRADYIPPTVTTLFLLDAAGRAARTLPAREQAALYFSAADYDYTPAKTYRPVRAEATKLSYRYVGAAAWTPLTLTQTGEDNASAVSTGLLFRADLTPVANVSWARVELKIELADEAGNTTTLLMAPAFSVGGEYPARRRASH